MQEISPEWTYKRRILEVVCIQRYNEQSTVAIWDELGTWWPMYIIGMIISGLIASPVRTV